MIIQSIHCCLVEIDSEFHMFNLSQHEIHNSLGFTVVHPEDFPRTEHRVGQLMPTNIPTSRVINYPMVGLRQHDVVWSVKGSVLDVKVDLRVADPEVTEFDLPVRLQPESVFVALLALALEPGQFICACQG